MNTIVICRAKIGDEAELTDVLNQTRQATYANETLNILPQDVALSSEEIAAYMKKWPKLINGDENSVLVRVAKCNGKIVGLCYCSNHPQLGKFVQYLYVLPEYQRCGIGSRLLEEAFTWFGTVSSIELGVVGYNARAQAFYRKHGFRDNGRGHGTLGGKSVTVLEMVKT